MDQLLSIDTLIERPRVAIDGAPYDILSPDELPLLTSQRIAALGRKLDRLMKADTLNATGEADIGATVRQIADIIMEPVPIAVRAKLSETQLLSVVEVFTMLSLGRKTKLAGAAVVAATKARTPADGAKPSSDASASTAATPPAG